MGLRKLLAALADPSLQERHWVAIAEAVGFEVRPDESTTLRRLIEYGIQDNIPVSFLHHPAHSLMFSRHLSRPS